MFVEDTIAAIASAPGGALRGIIRISGPETLECVHRSFHAATDAEWHNSTCARRLGGHLLLGAPIGNVPSQLYLWPTKRSYTRQPVAEFHTLGSLPLLHAALRKVCESGARLAEPGEFTLRAFLAGRIDLAQAEAVLAVIDAHDRTQLEVALTQLAGGISGPLEDLRNRLLNLQADLEAGLDFVDEYLEFISRDETFRQLEEAAATIREITHRLNRREEADATPRVVIRGWPNVGKSSLWNALIGKPQAIVTDQAGTTRDYLTARLELDGVSCTLIDTAGVELAATHRLGTAAQDAAQEQCQQCDLLMLCFDGTRELNAWEHDELELTRDLPHIVVWTKSDLPQTKTLESAIHTSSNSGQGILQLRRVLRTKLLSCQQDQATVVGSTATRCRESLRMAAAALARARDLTASLAGDELVVAELRHALEELGKVVGAVYTDDVLDRVFSRFCIGK